MGADFVFGFVQSMDGERDPRNLLLAFQIARNIIHRNYDIDENTDEHAHIHTVPSRVQIGTRDVAEPIYLC